ncbi:MAG: hypothetical protein ACRD8O_15230 [Bryobacteraceae bacterium]
MRRSFLPLVFSLCALAQNPLELFDKAPPHVDQALRERIGKFYQAHVDGRPRAAEKYVAEDTQDFYYTANKPRYLSFAIDKIVYSDNFTKALATVLCEQHIMLPGFAGKPVKVPAPSRWKIVDGEWFWYVDPETVRDTPFGRMKPGAAPQGGAAQSPGLDALANAPKVEDLWAQVKVDKSSISLKAGAASSDKVIVSSRLPGTVQLSLDTSPKTKGLNASLDRTELKSGEQATVTIRSDLKSAADFVVRIRVQPTNQEFAVAVAIR